MEEIIDNQEDQANEPHTPTELEALKVQCEEYLNGWKRGEALMKDLISVLDSFALAAAAIPKTDNAYKGLSVIQSQLEEVLKKHGLEKITANIGDIFNPAHHEAIALVDGNGKPEGTVAEVMEKGYTLNGKVLKPARVTVTK